MLREVWFRLEVGRNQKTCMLGVDHDQIYADTSGRLHIPEAIEAEGLAGILRYTNIIVYSVMMSKGLACIIVEV